MGHMPTCVPPLSLNIVLLHLSLMPHASLFSGLLYHFIFLMKSGGVLCCSILHIIISVISELDSILKLSSCFGSQSDVIVNTMLYECGMLANCNNYIVVASDETIVSISST